MPSVSVSMPRTPPGGQFESGDVVRFYGDPPEALFQLLNVSYAPDGIGGWLLDSTTQVRSLHPTTAWMVGGLSGGSAPQIRRIPNSLRGRGLLEFVRRPSPGELVLDSYPVNPRAGAREAAEGWVSGRPLVDEEFLAGLHSYLHTSDVFAGADRWNAWFQHNGGYCHSVDAPGPLVPTPLPSIQELRRGLTSWLLADQGVRLCAVCDGTHELYSDSCSHLPCYSCGRHVTEDSLCGSCSDDEGDNICSHCCECESCAVCSSGHSSRHRCPRCSGVGECCHCPRCEEEGCGRVGQPCCDRCTDHCNCSEYCIPLKNRAMRHYTAERKDRSKLRRLIGAEIEVAGMRVEGNRKPIRETLLKWNASVVRDGSIGRGGVEIVTSPAAGAQWTAMISEIGEGLKKAKAWTSERCGQHIHVDARDLKGRELAKLIQLYAEVEDALFAALPGERRDSSYCTPCGPKYVEWLKDSEGRFTPHALAVKLYSVYSRVKSGLDPKARYKTEKSLVEAQSTQKYANVRYNALNLHSYWHRGTIEFRHAHGTNNPEQIRNWGVICASIVEAAATFTHAQMQMVEARDNSRAALLYIVDQVSGEAKTAQWLQSRWAKFVGHYERDEMGEL